MSTRITDSSDPRVQAWVGKKFNRLTLVRFVRMEKYPTGGQQVWECTCECGRTVIVQLKQLKSGNTKSCGCFQLERTRERSTIHGFCRPKNVHPIYRSWQAMLSRCNNSNRKDWPYYGGRGISVCERWMSFENFKCDMLPSWKPGLTIERKDNDSNYCLDNCVWATRKTQAINRGMTKFLTFDGETLCLAAWSEKLGINPDTISMRLRRGWSTEKALSTPA